MKRIYIVLFLIFLVSCKSNKPNNDLELIIENKSIVIKDTLQPNYYSLGEGYKEKYEKTNGHIISYKLVNNSDKKYAVFINSEEFYCHSKWATGETVYPGFYFTNKNDSIYENQIYKMSPRVDYGIGSYHRILSDCRMLSDSLTVERYKKIGYGDDKYFPVRNNWIKGHLYYLHPKETIHLKTFVTLPFQITFDRAVLGYNTFDKNKDYYFRLVLISSKEFLENGFTTEQLRNIEVNGYEFFEGAIYSNKVPVKFE